jgi:hypothetical protein
VLCDHHDPANHLDAQIGAASDALRRGRGRADLVLADLVLTPTGAPVGHAHRGFCTSRRASV